MRCKNYGDEDEEEEEEAACDDDDDDDGDDGDDDDDYDDDDDDDDDSQGFPLQSVKEFHRVLLRVLEGFYQDLCGVSNPKP